MGSYDVSLGTSAELDITFPEGSSLDNSKEYKLLLCANIKDYLEISGVEDLKTLCDGEKENDVLALLMRISGVAPGLAPEVEQADNSHRMPMNNLPMGATVVKKANETAIDVELTHVVTRFDVFCEAEGYELCSASIWNAYAASFIWEGSFTDFTQPRTERYYGVEVNANKEIVGSLYAFENYVSSPSQKDKVTTCLIIGLKNLGSGKVEYFRTNVNVSSITGHQLKRNNVYRTVVRSVNNTGDETERGAYENGELLLDIDISNWLVDDSGIIQIEGQNVLAIPTSDIRLFSQGDKREYYVYTIGNGVPVIESTHLPGHMSASLKLAPGYHENLNFKASILTLKATSGTADKSENYYVEITFGTMSVSMAITQEGIAGNYVNLSEYDILEFSSVSGEESEEIIVTSSGSWVAEIAYGDYFSFVPETQELKLSGNSGEGFNMYTIKRNSDPETRYCFVKVSLADFPAISRVIVLAQHSNNGNYLFLDPTSVPDVATEGGSTESIQVYSTGNWTAELFVSGGGNAGFNGNPSLNRITGTGDGSFTVTFSILTTDYVYPQAEIMVTLDGTDIKESMSVYQKPLSEGVLVWTNTVSYGILALPGETYYSRYVYNLGTNMRNPDLFGPQGTVHMRGGYQFKQAGFAKDMEFAKASVFQAINSPQVEEYQRLKQVMDEYDNKFLMICTPRNTNTHMGTSLDRYMSVFGISGYAKTATNASANVERYFHKDAKRVLIDYLLETGPFTTERIDRGNIKLYSHLAYNIGLSAWPETFIPLIMVDVKSTPYCVFGIDPANRLIWIGDPGIFGSDGKSTASSYSNYKNYLSDKQDNIKFLNNFISWMTMAVTEGSAFLDGF